MRITFPILFAVLAACGPSMQSGDGGSGVRLDVDPAAASPGDTVLLTLTNASPDPIGYNLCSSGLEVRGDGEWRAVPSNRICTLELRALEVGTDTSYRFDLPPDLAPGEYRVTTTVERLEAGDRVGVGSGAFMVRQEVNGP